MSRIGKQPIEIPQGVDFKIEKNLVTISKDGKVLQQQVDPAIKVNYDKDNSVVSITRPTNNKVHRALHGLYRSLLNNMVVGVTSGFSKKLLIVGVGYRAELKGKNLFLNLGYSHPILFKPPENVDIKVENPTTIVVSGFDKQLVGQIAAKIRSFRPPEPYKGKGIKYDNEQVRRKAGKTAA